MNENLLPTLTNFEGPSNGWTACLKRGEFEIWFAGGPGIGRLGYTFPNGKIASAALKSAMDKEFADDEFNKRADTSKIVDEEIRAFNLRVEINCEAINEKFEVISAWMDGYFFGHILTRKSSVGDFNIMEGLFLDYGDADNFARFYESADLEVR